MAKASFITLCLFFLFSPSARNLVTSFYVTNNNYSHKTTRQAVLLFAGKGFGKDSANYTPASKSYGEKEVAPIKDLIDEESSMREFFESNEAWQPLFRSITTDDSVPAMSFIDAKNDDADEKFELSETSSPWKQLGAIPTDESDLVVLGEFLDAMQKSLIEDIPVDETTKDDENDLHFVEEGRRMLVCTRYHVVQGMEKGSIDTFERLFSICWSEITELRQTNEIDTGSLIVTPGFDYDDLRRFVDMNLQRPLQWMGKLDDFEVASLEKGGLGVIRIIHKLSDIPTENPGAPPPPATE